MNETITDQIIENLPYKVKDLKLINNVVKCGKKW